MNEKPLRTGWDFAYIVCKCVLVLSIAFAFVYTPLVSTKTIKSELKATRESAIIEIQDTRKAAVKEIHDSRQDIIALVNVRFESLQKSALKLATKADNRIGSVEKNTFQLANDLRTDSFKRIDTAESHANTQITTLNGNVGKLLTEYTKLPSKVGAKLNERFGEQTDCVNNRLCVQNLASDMMIDARYGMRDFSEASKLFSKDLPIFLDHSKQITGNFAGISKNIEYWSHPRWYYRVLDYGVKGVTGYGIVRPATQVVSGTISLINK